MQDYIELLCTSTSTTAMLLQFSLKSTALVGMLCIYSVAMGLSRFTLANDKCVFIFSNTNNEIRMKLYSYKNFK